MKPLCPAIICMMLTNAAFAADVRYESVYSKIDLNACAPIASDIGPQSGTENCGGAFGYAVANNDNHGHAIVYLEPYYSQGRYNTVSNGDGTRSDPKDFRKLNTRTGWSRLGSADTSVVTLEWRLKVTGEKREPVALILRHGGSLYGKQRQEFLTVLKLGADQSCPVATLPANTTTGANERARAVADEMAEAFDCVEDEPVE